MKKKTLSLLLALCLAFTGAVLPLKAGAVEAASPADFKLAEPRYGGMALASGVLDLDGKTCVTSGSIVAYSGYTSDITATLQQCPPNGNWGVVTTFYSTSVGGGSSVVSGRYGGTSGYRYRVLFHFRTYNSAGTCVDDEYRYSSVHTVP